jgi:hypothetical protein
MHHRPLSDKTPSPAWQLAFEDLAMDGARGGKLAQMPGHWRVFALDGLGPRGAESFHHRWPAKITTFFAII